MKPKLSWKRPVEFDESQLLPMEEWKEGPWHAEPWRVEWKDEHGLRCLVIRGHAGNLCGYVRVPFFHPWYRHGYSNQCLDDPACGKEWCKHTPEAFIDVHGGLTFSGKPFGVSRGWWIGFDCAHLDDLTPGTDAVLRKLGGGLMSWQEDAVYRDLEYVLKEVASMATQMWGAKAPKRPLDTLFKWLTGAVLVISALYFAQWLAN